MNVTNEKLVRRNAALLDKLSKEVTKSHKTTFDRVTKDFETPQDFSKASFIDSKFSEYFGGYPSKNRRIKRSAGPEQALQVYGEYGGKNLTQAYTRRIADQYETSIQRRHEVSFDLRDKYRKSKDEGDTAEEEVLKKQRENLQRMFGYSRKDQLKGGLFSSGIFKKGKKNGEKKSTGGKNDSDDDDDDDDDDDGDDPTDDARSRMLRKELRRFVHLTNNGKKQQTSVNTSDGRPPPEDNSGNLIDFSNAYAQGNVYEQETPSAQFGINASVGRAEYLDPVSGEVRQGYSVLGDQAINKVIISAKDSLINTSVAGHRTNNNPNKTINDRGFRNYVFRLADQQDDMRDASVNQFGESSIDDNMQNPAFGQDKGITFSDMLQNNARELAWDSYGENLATTVDFDDGSTSDDYFDDYFDGELRQRRTQQQIQREPNEPADFYLPENTYSRRDDDDDNAPQGGRIEAAQTGEGGTLTVQLSEELLDGLLEELSTMGYDQDQLGIFLEDMSLPTPVFANLSIEDKVQLMSSILSEANINENPQNSSLTADEIIRAEQSKQRRRETGETPNLLSKDFQVTSQLNSITPLAHDVNKPIRTIDQIKLMQQTIGRKPSDYNAASNIQRGGLEEEEESRVHPAGNDEDPYRAIFEKEEPEDVLSEIHPPGTAGNTAETGVPI